MLLPHVFLAILAGAKAPSAVDPARMREHVFVLASDALEGREAGTRGAEVAAKYIVQELCAIGVEPAGDGGGFLQTFPLDEKKAAKLKEPATAPKTANILAAIKGADPQLATQWLVVGAHYDHVGRQGNGQIHNGADDNASGTAGAIEIARLLAARTPHLRRSVLIALFGAEEEGLLGSFWYVRHPTQPLEQTVFMLNMDMIGRSRCRTLQVGGVGTSPVLSDLVTRLAGEIGLHTVLNKSGAAPSDNTCFYQRNIPVLFLFSGVHADYHQPGDDAEKIEFTSAAAIATLGLRVVEEIANAAEPPPFTPTPGNFDYWAPRRYVGMTYDDAPGGGAALDIVIPGSPADRCGLRVGDIVVTLDGKVVADRAGLDRLVQELPIGEPLKCRVMRAGSSIEIELTIGVK
ncbi:MAG: M28 family peptidase [Planctomycetota bacterium]